MAKTEEQRRRHRENVQRARERLTPEQRQEQRRRWNATWKAKNPERVQQLLRDKWKRQRERRRNGPDAAMWAEKDRLRMARYYLRNRDAILARQRAAYGANRAPACPAIIFPLCAAPSPARDLLLHLRGLVRGPEADDIVAEALLIIVEGEDDIQAAIRAARTQVYRGVNKLAYAKPLEECFWL